MAYLRDFARAIFALLVFATVWPCADLALAQDNQNQNRPPQRSPDAISTLANTTGPVGPEGELQQAINSAGNDRAALVRNLESFLQKYPESEERPHIYRALVEASLQLRDTARATNYAERIVALNPEDASVTILAIQLLEQNGDDAGLRRAINYASRVLEFVERTSLGEKSPRTSPEDWETKKKADRMSVLSLRGRLYLKLHDTASARNDFQASYAIVPNAAAAERLGEIAELKTDLNAAILEYARAFALADEANGVNGRREVRQKLGNVWRLTHGSDDGLGEYLLRAYDDVAEAARPGKSRKNAGAREPFDFTLRRAPDGAPFPLAGMKGKVLVVNFWATWCGPCRAQEPLFEHVATRFKASPEVFFLAADCDEDETLVPAYLQQEKPRTTVVFADGLEHLLAVNEFPTVVVIDRAGKIAYRSEGYAAEIFERDLTAAIQRTIAPDRGAPASGSPTP
jgi:thiol-disulfide isomerase/thioredoxin